MSIRKKMIFSNIILLIVPVLALFLIDIVLGYIIIVSLNGSTETFVTLRFILIVLVFVIVNISISLIISRHIIHPIKLLNKHAERIGEGNLDTPITIDRKDEIGILASSFESMRRELKASKEKEEEYYKNRQELMASMSHDLKTPLTSIKGYVNGLEDGVADTPEKQMRYTTVIKQSINRLEHMIDDLFMYSKLDLEDEDFKFYKVNLNHFLNDIVTEYQMEHSDIEIVFNGEQNVYVSADREQLYRAVSNMIDNSIKYGDKDRTLINICLNADGDNVYIGVKDNGSGIDSTELNQVFEAFYRADQSRNSNTGGTGLGLSIVKRIIERHNGEVSIESEKDTGTVVSIKLQREIE